MLNVFGRLRHGLLIFCQRLCGLLSAVILVVGLFGCGPPTITLELLTSLNRHARVEHSCHRLYGSNGQLHYGVQRHDENQIITEDTPERIIDAVKTADVITLYAPDTPACRAKSRVQLGVIWTLAAPPHELPELHLSPTVREALESSLTQASRAEPESINKVFFGQVATWRDPRLTMQQAETITQTLRQALRGHVNDLIEYGPLGRDFAKAHGQLPKPTTVEPIDTPLVQGVGGLAAGILEAMVPLGPLTTQALIDDGVLPRGTRGAQLGKALGEIGAGGVQLFLGADGVVIGGGMSLTGGGAIAGVPLCIGSLALAANGAVTLLHGAKSLTVILCRWEDEPAAGASAPPGDSPSAAPAPTPATPPAAKPVQAPAQGAKPAAKPITSSTGQTPAQPPKRRGAGTKSGKNTTTWTKCTGQEHHAISRTVHKALEEHRLLKGIYKPRDNRFVTQAINKEAHKGYQTWHRKLDDEIVRWIEKTEWATPKDFEAYLHKLYAEARLKAIFPNGL